MQPDEEDNIGGTFLESGDIRTIATKMSTALLSTPEISGSEQPVRIALAPIRNSTRFMVDQDILMKRLRLELSRYGAGRVTFFAQNVGQGVRREVLQEQDEALWDKACTEVAEYLLRSPTLANAATPPTIAVIPVRNTNLAGLNADSFTELIRAKIAEQANGKVVFLAREKNGKAIEELLNEKDLKKLDMVQTKKMKELFGVDYFLGGELISEGIATAGVTTATSTWLTERGNQVSGGTTTTSLDPNVTKQLNVMLIDADDGSVPVEKLVTLERKMKSGLASAEYVLTGELSAESKASAGGERSDYIMMTFQLIDPQSNKVLWEDGYETKKKSKVGTVYQ
jgi:TolB-like protein